MPRIDHAGTHIQLSKVNNDVLSYFRTRAFGRSFCVAYNILDYVRIQVREFLEEPLKIHPWYFLIILEGEYT
jgi:hypothetical protein